MLGEKVVLCGFLQAESPGGILLVRGAPLPRNVEDTEQSFVSKDVMTFREAVQFSYKFTFFNLPSLPAHSILYHKAS